jgi:two-component system, OmpR family, sensor kinase
MKPIEFPSRRHLVAYAFATGIVSLGLIGQFVLEDILNQVLPPFILLYPSVFLASWFGGLFPGFWATGFASVTSYYLFVPERYSFRFNEISDAIALGIFAAMGIMFSLVNENLRRVALERERAILKYKETEKSLHEALRARDEFLSVTGHELKTPISAILLKIQILIRKARGIETVPRDEVMDAVEPSLKQLRKLAQMIDNLLDVSRIGADRLSLDLENVDLCEIARDTVIRLNDQASSQGSPLKLETCESAVGRWDRFRLEQVLTNLITNGIKYGAGHPVEVRVHKKYDIASVEVVDRGIGIHPNDHGRVFERFERGTTEHKNQSLGLGLYIVEKLVKAHGGRVRLESALGQGAKFTVELPLL